MSSENSHYKYRVAPDMAMTVKMIMILLYGAGGEPGRGEIPMIQISSLHFADNLNYPDNMSKNTHAKWLIY